MSIISFARPQTGPDCDVRLGSSFGWDNLLRLLSAADVPRQELYAAHYIEDETLVLYDFAADDARIVAEAIRKTLPDIPREASRHDFPFHIDPRRPDRFQIDSVFDYWSGRQAMLEKLADFFATGPVRVFFEI